jgi:hypothetical protein
MRALLLVHRCQHRRLDLGSEALERHHASGSPFAVIAASRRSASKNPNCPIVPTPANLVSQIRLAQIHGGRIFFEVPYIRKPFSQRLLVEHVKVVLRRSGGTDSTAPKETDAAKVLERGQLRIDPERHTCTWKNEPVS